MQFELSPLALPEGYAESILPLADVKRHLSYLEDDRDAEIGVYRDAAIDMVEKYCAVRLAPVEDVKVRIETLSSPQRLGVAPVTAINSITWLDDAGVPVLGDEDDWRIIRHDTIGLKPGRTLPTNIAAGIEIMFDAGFETPPPVLVQAARMFTAHLFRNREAASTCTISGEILLGFKMLCGQHRVPVI